MSDQLTVGVHSIAGCLVAIDERINLTLDDHTLTLSFIKDRP